MAKVYRNLRLHPTVPVLLQLVNLPIFITFSFALRDMCGLPSWFFNPSPGGVEPSLQASGLVERGPWWELPLGITVVHLLNIEVGFSLAEFTHSRS